LDREALRAEIHAVLEQEPRFVFAYLYGSFCREEPFQDIDIGVYAEKFPGTSLRSRAVDTS
jgi:predicted nucleotidyltransferase